MKVLFECRIPYRFWHGGMQIQIEKTKAALTNVGIEVDYFRWWDSHQGGDLLHFWGKAPVALVRAAQESGMPVLVNPLLTAACNYSDLKLGCEAVVRRVISSIPIGKKLAEVLDWTSYREANHAVVLLNAEERVLLWEYGVSPAQVSVVPLGMSDIFLQAGPGRRSESHLICTGTITPRKRTVELAEMAKAAEAPILFVGKAYTETDPYWKQFRSLIDDRWVKYHSHVESESEMVQLLQSARGFVLMSKWESWSASAQEAAACGLPLLLPDQNWARDRYGSEVRYFAKRDNRRRDTEILRQFYQDSLSLQPPKVHHYSWPEVAQQLRTIYGSLCASR
jgi:glycosyltransferase involved in cell wall biosynthesis